MTDISSMFSSCNKLTTLDVSRWSTNNITDLYATFSNCHNLTTINVSRWNVRNVSNVSGMFASCNNLTNDSVLDIARMLCNINISKIPAAQRNLMNNNSRSPFSGTKFNNSYYTSMIPALQAAGWTC